MKRAADKLGPVRWCRRCARRHPSHADCGLIKVTVPAKNGRMVERLIHPRTVEK